MDAKEHEILLWLVEHDSRENLALLPNECATARARAPAAAQRRRDAA